SGLSQTRKARFPLGEPGLFVLDYRSGKLILSLCYPTLATKTKTWRGWGTQRLLVFICRSNKVRSCDCPGCVDDLSEPHPQAKLNLALAIVVGTVYAERLAKRCGVGFEAGEEGERGEGAVKTSRADAVAGSFNLCNVLVVEQVERFREQFQLAKFAEIEVLSQAHVGLPYGWITESVAADVVHDLIVANAIDQIVAARSIHPRSQAGDCVSVDLAELL